MVRIDLTLPQQICQAVHAAYESGMRLAEPTEYVDRTVICQVPDEDGLLKAKHYIEQKGIRTILFREPDIDNQATAMATEPMSELDRRKLSKFKLWEGNPCLV